MLLVWSCYISWWLLTPPRLLMHRLTLFLTLERAELLISSVSFLLLYLCWWNWWVYLDWQRVWGQNDIIFFQQNMWTFYSAQQTLGPVNDRVHRWAPVWDRHTAVSHHFACAWTSGHYSVHYSLYKPLGISCKNLVIWKLSFLRKCIRKWKVLLKFDF